MREQIAKALADVCPCELFVPKYACMWKRTGEWLVTRIDRHKRIAKLRTSLWGDERLIRVGLEVLTKTA